MSLDHVEETEADYTCYKCGLSFTRDKGYFPCESTTLENVLCYCCANDTHYVILSDINKNRIFPDTFPETCQIPGRAGADSFYCATC